MLKLQLNRVRFDLRLVPQTPLLVRAGDKGATLLHPELPDLMFVRTGPLGDETVFVPGSSIKGVVRSAAERVLRTVGRTCCDPMEHKSDCHERASRKGDEIARNSRSHDENAQAEVHRLVCFACRTFGSQAVAAHVSFADALPPSDMRARTNRTERRNGVSIDRRTGGPARGKLFDMDVVAEGAFDTSIHGLNLQLWQVGLLGIVLHDANAGFVRFGGGKSRGLGHVRVQVRKVVFEQTDVQRRFAAPQGTAALRPDLAGAYGLVAEQSDRLADAASGIATPTPVGTQWAWEGDAGWSFLDACAGEPWAAFCAGAR